MIAGDLEIGNYIRSPKNAKHIYVVKSKNPSSSVFVWRFDPHTKKDMANDFMHLQWTQVIIKVSI